MKMERRKKSQTLENVTLPQNTEGEVTPLERHFVEPSENDKEIVPSLFLDDLSSVEIEPTEWILEGFLPLGQSLTGVVGESSCGKSTLVYDIALDYITGKNKYFDCDMYGDPEERTAVILFSEGNRQIMTRIRGYLQEHNLSLKDTKGKLFLLDYPELVKNTNDPYLSTVKTLTTLEKSLKSYRNKFSMIIIDTLNGFYGGKENSADEMGTFLSNINAHLAVPFDSNVIIIHHTGLESNGQKNAEDKRPRGSTAFVARLDSLIMCSGKITRGMEVCNNKQRDGESGHKFFIKSKQIPVESVRLNSKGKRTTTVVVDKSINPSELEKTIKDESQDEKMKRKATESKRMIEEWLSDGELPFDIEMTDSGNSYRFTSEDLIPLLENDLGDKATPGRIAQELNPGTSKTIGSLVEHGLLKYQQLGKKNYVFWTLNNKCYKKNTGIWFISFDAQKEKNKNLLDTRKRKQKKNTVSQGEKEGILPGILDKTNS